LVMRGVALDGRRAPAVTASLKAGSVTDRGLAREDGGRRSMSSSRPPASDVDQVAGARRIRGCWSAGPPRFVSVPPHEHPERSKSPAATPDPAWRGPPVPIHENDPQLANISPSLLCFLRAPGLGQGGRINGMQRHRRQRVDGLIGVELRVRPSSWDHDSEHPTPHRSRRSRATGPGSPSRSARGTLARELLDVAHARWVMFSRIPAPISL